ncbi:Protein yls7 [Dionaea muscipula]
MGSMKDYHSTSSYPKLLSSIVLSVGILAFFITFASWVLSTEPIGAAVRSYFYGVDHIKDYDSPIVLVRNKTNHLPSNSSIFLGNETSPEIQHDEKKLGSDSSSKETGSVNTVLPENTDSVHDGDLPTTSSSGSRENNAGGSVDSDCDLYHGEWVFDQSGPLYRNNTCPVITQMQNCQGNGRPDKGYENWRWKPSHCKLPRFNGTKFLELMSDKTLAFIGDSVARNQMESLLCILWQVEAPKNRGNRHMQRWYFRSKNVMIVRIWSSWLVHQTSEPFSYIPKGVVKVHLDIPDENFMQYIPKFDVIVLSSGHWFAKQSIYLLNNEIVGTQLWSLPNSKPLKVNNVEAFGISVETILTAMATHPNYTGITIVRSFSPDHYEGGTWNTGGSCTGKVKPALPGQLVENGFTNSMHEKQVMGFNRASKKLTNRSRLKLMDITEAFQYRHDGHPGPYRSLDPNKKTTRGPDGKPPPQDCLHWCMPGPVDTWNELVLEIVRREYEGG